LIEAFVSHLIGRGFCQSARKRGMVPMCRLKYVTLNHQKAQKKPHKAALIRFGVLIYSNKINNLSGAPDWIRTSDPSLRRAVLYPSELRARFCERIIAAWLYAVHCKSGVFRRVVVGNQLDLMANIFHGFSGNP
jgi:hypothetical protein